MKGHTRNGKDRRKTCKTLKIEPAQKLISVYLRNHKNAFGRKECQRRQLIYIEHSSLNPARFAKCLCGVEGRVYTLALHKSRLMAISRSFQSRQVMQQFLLDRLIG